LGTFSALRQRDFALLWFSTLGQSAGLGMQQIALGYFVFDETDSEFWVGAVAFMNFAPFLLFSPLAGVIGDRVDRRNLLFFAQALSGGAILALAALITTGVVEIWHVMVVAGVAATGQALTVPTRLAYVNDLVEPGFLMNAVALSSLAQNGMRIIGPVAAGMLIAWIDSGGTMYVNAAGYLLGLFPLAAMASRPRPKVATVSALRNIAEGIGFARRTPVVLYVLLIGNVFCLFGMPYMSMLPVFAEEELGLGSTGLGVLSAATGAGAIAGGFMLARLGDTPRKTMLFEAFFLMFLVSLVFFSLSPSVGLSLVLLFVVGFGSMSHISMGTVILQLATPRELQARTMSLWTWAIALSFLGALPVGALAEVYGAPRVMAGSAGIGLLTGLAIMGWYRSEARRKPDQPELTPARKTG